MFGTMRDMMDSWGSLLARGRAFWPVVQARLVGGTTVINSAIVVRTPGDIFRLWKEERGFGGDELAHRYWTAQDEIEKELHVSPVPEDSHGLSNRHAKEGAMKLGYHDHDMVRSVKDCLGTGFCLQGCKQERKQSTNLNYVPEVLERGGHVVSCAPVQKIEFEERRAIGVSGRFVHPQTRKKGAAFFVRARKGVVVAASATHSPALLQRSGLKAPQVGAYFRAHPGAGVFGVYDEAIDMNNGATQGWSSTFFREQKGMKLETLSLPLELVASRLSGGGTTLMRRIQNYRHLAMWVVAVRTEAVGRVDASPFTGGPTVRFNPTKYDLQRFREGAYAVAQIHVAQGAKEIIPGVAGMPYSIKPDEIDKILEVPLEQRCWTGILSHLFGGCVMGTNDLNSVCDPHGKVYGCSGLYVADASAIPTTLGVNPQHTVMALGKVVAEDILNGH
jgi:choline dehydrogenase-like flavoprotein